MKKEEIFEKINFYTDRILNHNHSEEDEYLFYKYGPFILNNHPSIESIKINDPLINYTISAICLDRMVKRGSSISTEASVSFNQMKKDLVTFKRECCLSKAPETRMLFQVAEEHIKRLRNHQKKNYILESAMVNYSPIVPYARFVKKPGATDEWILPEGEKLFVDKDSINDKTKIKKIIDASYIQNIFSLLEATEEPFHQTSEIIFESWVSQIEPTTDTHTRSPLEYFVAVEYYFNFEMLHAPEVLKAHESIQNLFDENLETVINDMVDSNMIMETATNELKMEHTLESLRSDNLIFRYLRNIDISMKERTNFNIDKLIGFLHINTAYICTEFSNNQFLKQSGVRDYSFLENEKEPVMLAILDDKYLCIPIIDQSDNWKTKVLYIDNEDRINVSYAVPGSDNSKLDSRIHEESV